MQSEAPRRPPGKILALTAVASLALYGAYQGVRWGLRAYTTGLVHDVAGRDLPSFSLVDRDGRTWSAHSLRGKKVVLNFFRSRCASCWHERDLVEQFARERDPARVVVLGVMMDRVQGYPEAVTEQTLTRFGYRHPVLMADAAFVDAFHGVGWSHITPITYVADEAGKVVATLRHPYAIDDLRAAVGG